MKILQVPVADLSHDPANARKHPERNLDTIVASLRRFGQQKPIVIDRNNIVRAGNGTLEAAKRLGWEKIACVRTELNGADATAYAIADNRSAELAEWDDEVLAATLFGLANDDQQLAIATGFSEQELERLFKDTLDNFESSGDDQDNPNQEETPEMKFSGVRMVQLFLDETNIEEFHNACAKLAQEYATENITDTVLEAVRRASSSL